MILIMGKILDKNVSNLKLEEKITEKLLENNIDTLLKVCNCTRIQLSNLEFSNVEINEIIINLQLMGLDLKKNHAKKNSLLKNKR